MPRYTEVAAALKRDLEAARFAAQRAGKQFDAIDPENRLVANELERRWNAALATVRTLERRVAEAAADSQTAVMTVEEFSDLARDLERIWT